MSKVPNANRKKHELSSSFDSARTSTEKPLAYEASAGGILVRHLHGLWQVALLEPNVINADSVIHRKTPRPPGSVFTLPKGGIEDGETAEQCAEREVFEETGVHVSRVLHLTDIRYSYVRSWGGGERVQKTVRFFLCLYRSGRLGQIDPDMRDEVRNVFWFPLERAHRKLTHRSERDVVRLAQKTIHEFPDQLLLSKTHR